MWREAVEQVANMMAMDPYPGFEGKYFSMPARNVVPKPVQKPHPPLWVACSNRETIHLAAQLGIGALTFAFIDPAEAQAVGGRLLRDLQAGVRADRPRGEPEHRHGHRLLVPPRRRRGAAPRHRRLPLLPVRARPPLRLRQAHARAAPTSGSSSRRCATQLGTDVLGGGAGCIGTPDELREHPARSSRTPAWTRPSSSSRAARTGTSTSASRSSCSPPR